MEQVTNQGFTTLLASLSPDALTRGKQFERLVKWWLTQDPIWSRKIKNVWLWDEWPDYPGRDIGIDLVAEMTDGTLCAVQAKCFDENRDIPKSELDSFISAATHLTFQHRLLVATTDGLSANARRMLADQHVVRVMRSDLESSLDVWPASIDELSAPAQPHASPRPHQNLAITDVTNGFDGNSRGQLIMACGTGKTLTALWIKETLKPKTTLVLVPSLNLLAQTLSEWAKNSLSPWQYLCVCSDDTVNKLDDQPISTVGDLPFEVTTNPADIAKFLTLGGERIIFSTYQSSAQVAKAQEQSGVLFDLVICDEAHRLTGKTDADYATVLDEKKIVGQKRLFMTATPRTYTTAAKTKAEDRGVEITSMDDEHIYGPVLHKLSFGEAIKQDLLSDYRVLIVGVTDPQVQDLIDRRELVSVNDSVNTDARTLAAHIGLAKATKDYNLKRTISFHSRIKSADQFAKDHLMILDWLPDSHKPSGNTWTGTISGAMNTGDRRRLIKQLSLDGNDRHALLTNARCLTEGVDVPSLDGVAFIDPRSSQIDIIQAVGRAIRKSKNKEIGTIVLPILISTESNAEDAVEDTAFRPIWAVLNALKSHDEDFAVELNHLRTELGRSGNIGDLPTRLVEDLPTNIDLLLPGFSEKLAVAILEKSTASWDFMFGKLQKYAAENGHCNPPQKATSNKSLAAWVNHQRMSFNGTKSKKLSPEQCAKLESLPNWQWKVHDSVWTTTYEKLLQYANERKALSFNRSETLEGSLSRWATRQRHAYFAGNLEDYRKALLEQVPNWEWNPIDSKWDKDFEKLQQYKADTGGSNPLPKEVHNGFRLGSWVVQQRVRYRNGMLTEEQIRCLEELENWSWAPDDLVWTNKFNTTYKYAQREGHLRLSTSHREDGLLIGKWVVHQRGCYKKGILSEERTKLIETIPGWQWDPIQDSWMTQFQELKNFTETNKLQDLTDSNLATKKPLLTWIRKQRTRYTKGSLNTDEITLLASIPGWAWTSPLSQWEVNFAALRQYADESGTAMAPEGFRNSDGIGLGYFCQAMRNAYRKGSLSGERIAKLETLEGWEWYPHEAEWNRKFESLSEIVRQNGSLTTAHKIGINQILRTWFSAQRTAYKQGNLEDEKIALLESIDGWTWDPLQSAWDEGYLKLEEYVLRNGHARPPHGLIIDGFNVGSWVLNQRQRYSAGTISQDQAEQLMTLKGWVWVAKNKR